MVDTNVSLAVMVALLVALDLVLVACLASNRAAAAVVNVARCSVGWVESTAGSALAFAAAVARRP